MFEILLRLNVRHLFILNYPFRTTLLNAALSPAGGSVDNSTQLYAFSSSSWISEWIEDMLSNERWFLFTVHWFEEKIVLTCQWFNYIFQWSSGPWELHGLPSDQEVQVFIVARIRRDWTRTQHGNLWWIEFKVLFWYHCNTNTFGTSL